ncbi:MAG: signal recognition particle-docking protein FtsY [Gammaproteobacteria bacterium]|nr:signal recognition particle-docking protein FtsY [Gammaproteobacteria bacterium]
MNQHSGLFAYLSRTRQSLANRLGGLLSSGVRLDDSVYEALEDHLVMADFGIRTASGIVDHLKKSAAREKVAEAAELSALLERSILDMLSCGDGGQSERSVASPHVILMVGVNGVGKTTTLAKLANFHKRQGCSVMMAAGDTFRAAAVEQLQAWGRRLDVPVIAQSIGSDAAAVAFDAVNSAMARNIDCLLIDSAGRQHTQGDLMDQLQKMKRVIGKLDPSAPHEILMTVDAGNGQNVLSQVENFQKRLPLSGICVTKLDGTAKGGVIVALVDRFRLPVRYIGIGEGIDDLREFSPAEFAAALFPYLSDSQAESGMP